MDEVKLLFCDHRVSERASSQGCSSSMLEEINVRGQSLRIASISVTIVWSSVRRTFALPKTEESSVRPMSRSQKPPYKEARFGMNFHCTVRVSRSGDFRSFSSSSAAD